jgi:hypothetical protein
MYHDQAHQNITARCITLLTHAHTYVCMSACTTDTYTRFYIDARLFFHTHTPTTPNHASTYLVIALTDYTHIFTLFVSDTHLATNNCTVPIIILSLHDYFDITQKNITTITSMQSNM